MKGKYTACMSLRLTPEVDHHVGEAANEEQISKATWIRMAILHRLRGQCPGQKKNRFSQER
jgi:hypothetical protein